MNNFSKTILFCLIFIFLIGLAQVVKAQCPPAVCQDLFDRVGAAFGSSCGDPAYDHIVDTNKDGTIDIFDISTISALCGSDGAACQAIANNTFNPCAPAVNWPHVSINVPGSVVVNQEFSVSLTYTHDNNEQGGIHLRWVDNEFDVTDTAGCDHYDNPAFAPGWEGIECASLSSGTTKTFKLKALATGAQTLYYRAWDLVQDYDCGGGNFDYPRDPSSGTCSASCEPSGFPDLWEVCDAYSRSITVTAPAFDFSLSASPSFDSVNQGDSTSTSVTATLVSGATQTVTLSASTPDPTITFSWIGNSCNPTCSRTLVMTTTAATPTALHPITITGTGGGVTRTTNFNLTVGAVPCTRDNPVVTISPFSHTGSPGDLKTYNIQVENKDIGCGSSDFNLTIRPLPAGWSSNFAENPLTIDSTSTESTTLDVTSSPAAPADDYDIVVGAANLSDPIYNGSDMARYTVAIAPPPCTRANPRVRLLPSPQFGDPGDLRTFTIEIRNEDTAACSDATFDLSVDSCPPGWSCILSDPSVPNVPPQSVDSSATVRVTSSIFATPDDYTFSVKVVHPTAGPGFEKTGSATYTVTALPCARNDPTVTFLAPKDYVGNPGTLALYTIEVTNNDTKGCGPSEFQSAPHLPVGWTDWSISDSSPEIDPSETVALNLSVTSPTIAVPAVYNIGASFMNLSDPASVGRDQTATYEVLTVCLRYFPDIVLVPDYRYVIAGTPVTYRVDVTNMDAAGCNPSTFALSCSCPGGWPQCALDQSMFPNIDPGETFSTTFRVTSPSDAIPQNPYTVSVTAVNAQSALSKIFNGTYTVSAPICDRHDPEISLDPEEQIGDPGDELIYIVNVTNADSADCPPSNFLLTSSCEPGWPTCHLGERNFSSIPPQTSFSTTLTVKSLTTSATGDYPVSVTAQSLPAGGSTTFVGNYRVRGPCQVSFDKDTYFPGDTMTITYTDAPPPVVPGLANLTLCPPESPCTQWSVEGSDTVTHPVGAPPFEDLEDHWIVTLIVVGECEAFDRAWVTSGAPIPPCDVYFAEDPYYLEETMIIHYVDSPKPPAPGVVNLTLVSPEGTVQQWSVQGTDTVEYFLKPGDPTGNWGAGLYVGGIPQICDEFDSTTVEVPAALITCTALDGTCCVAPNPICTAGKITGHSDAATCPECCRYAEDCRAEGGGPIEPEPPIGGGFAGFIEKLINLIFWLAVGIVPLMIIIAAFYFITSGGDPDRVRTAKRIFTYTIIGFFIVLLARGIVSMVRMMLGGS